MLKELAENLPEGKVVSIVGLNKNVGKTTFLNMLIKQLAKVERYFLIMSIGRDGEKEDILEKTPKPSIVLPKGNYAVTSDRLLSIDSFLEVIESYSDSAGGKLFLAKATEDTSIQLINPGSMEKMKEIANLCLNSGYCSNVIIDGALNRSSHSSSEFCDYVVIVTGAEVEGDVQSIAQKTAFEVEKYELDICDDSIAAMLKDAMKKKNKTILIRNGDIIEMNESSLIESDSICSGLCDGDILFNNGAVTAKICDRLLSLGRKFILVVKDGAMLHLDFRSYRKLTRNGIVINSLNKVNVLAVVMNCNGIRRSLNSSDLLKALETIIKGKPLIDVMQL